VQASRRQGSDRRLALLNRRGRGGVLDVFVVVCLCRALLHHHAVLGAVATVPGTKDQEYRATWRAVGVQ